MITGSATGQFSLRWIQQPWQDQMNYFPFTFDHAWHSLQMIAAKWKAQLVTGNLLHWLATACVFASAVHLIVSVVRRLRGKQQTAENRWLVFLSTFYLGTTICSVAAVCYSGIIYNPPILVDVDWGGAARYFLPVLFLPFFFIGFWLIPLRAPAFRWLPAAVMASLMIGAGLLYAQCSRTPRGDDRAVWHYYPPFVAKLDAIAEQYGLEDGLAPFWETKVAMLLSRRNLRVHPVIAHPFTATHLSAFHWLSNSHWYFEPSQTGRGIPRYQFILVKEHPPIPTPTREQLTHTFGPPVATVPCGPYFVMIYNRPEDEAFQNIAQREGLILREKFQSRLHETIHFDARSLPSLILGAYPPDERIADPDETSEGLLSAGPSVRLSEAGDYRITFMTSSAAGEKSAGRYEVFLINPVNGWLHPIADGDLASGPFAKTVVNAAIQKRHRGRLLECRVHFNGTGILQMHHLEVTRIK